MSTENFPYDGRNEGVFHLALFLVASLVVHAGLGWFILLAVDTIKVHSPTRPPEERSPIQVELIEKRPDKLTYPEVIELPPGKSIMEGPQKEIKRYADRTNVFEKETIPERSPRAFVIPGSSGSSPSPPTARKPGGDTPKPGGRTIDEAAGGTAETPTSPGKASIEMPVHKGTKGAEEVTESAEKAATGPGPSAKGGAPGRGASIPEVGEQRPNLLLSEEQIARLTERYEKESPKGEKGKTLRLNTTELKYQKYLINMKHAIEFYWEYPVLAIRNGWQGKLNLNFTINKDGTITDIRLLKSSGYPVLDDSARTALKLAAPFPPFPEDFSIEQINIKGQFEYNLSYAPPPPMR